MFLLLKETLKLLSDYQEDQIFKHVWKNLNQGIWHSYVLALPIKMYIPIFQNLYLYIFYISVITVYIYNYN